MKQVTRWQQMESVVESKLYGNESNSSISILLLREGGVVEDRGGRRNNVCSYFFVNDRVMYSPTTSPYGYSSFPKEEIRDTIDFLVSPIRDTIDYHLAQNRTVWSSNQVFRTNPVIFHSQGRRSIILTPLQASQAHTVEAYTIYLFAASWYNRYRNALYSFYRRVY